MYIREIYRGQVKTFYFGDFNLSSEERLQLDALQKTLKLSEEEALEIEEKVLREKEENLRNIEEEIRRKEIEYRREKDRKEMMNLWIEHLKAKSEELKGKLKELEMISSRDSKNAAWQKELRILKETLHKDILAIEEASSAQDFLESLTLPTKKLNNAFHARGFSGIPGRAIKRLKRM
jgi:hypothetical protein